MKKNGTCAKCLGIWQFDQSPVCLHSNDCNERLGSDLANLNFNWACTNISVLLSFHNRSDKNSDFAFVTVSFQ